eukprot:963628-Rhodomonas_salina.1
MACCLSYPPPAGALFCGDASPTVPVGISRKNPKLCFPRCVILISASVDPFGVWVCEGGHVVRMGMSPIRVRHGLP